MLSLALAALTAAFTAATQPEARGADGFGLHRLLSWPGLMQADAPFLPLLVAGGAWVALRHLGGWALPLLMAGLLAGSAWPLVLLNSPHALALLSSSAVLTAGMLPVAALLLSTTVLRRIGLDAETGTDRVRIGLPLFAGLVVPAVAGLGAWALQQLPGLPAAMSPAEVLALSQAWALGLFCAGTWLSASDDTPGSGWGWMSAWLAGVALALQAAAVGRWLPSPWLLLPHVLLGLHAVRASQRHNALLAGALVLMWASAAPDSLTRLCLGAGLALLPWFTRALAQAGWRDPAGWRAGLEAQGVAIASWALPDGAPHTSMRWRALLADDSQAAPTGHSPLDWIRQAHARDREPVRQAVRGLLQGAGGAPLTLQLRLAADGGDWRWHELQAHVPERDSKGQARRVFMTLTDASWRQVADDRERMTATLFQQVDAGLAVVDLQGRIVEVNPAYCKIMREPKEALVGRTAAPLTVAQLRSNGHDPAELQARLARGEPWRGQLQISRNDAGHITLAVKLSPVPEGRDAGARWRVLCVNDLSDTLQQQDLLRRALRSDTATGLPNRDEFMRLLQQAMSDTAQDGSKLLVCLIDLDDFARVNTEHGPLVADGVLLQLSTRLRAALRGNGSAPMPSADQIARLHGDEFAVLIRVQTAEEAQRAVERLLSMLATPVVIRESRVGDGLALEISGSLGATVYPTDAADPETLLRHAGHALFRAKHAGRGGFQFYDPTTHPSDEAGLLALARLQRALDTGELVLHYQPQIDLKNGLVVGAEALLRWQHPERGLLTPVHFLPLIETTGLAVQLGDWVIEQALSQAVRWAQAGVSRGGGLPISINVSAWQLRRHDFPQRLQELIQRQPQGMAAWLHLDVLEADALAETVAAQALIQRCLSLGVGIALDDFGAGYSRLASMKRLTVDTLKIDRSLVQGMLGDGQDTSLVESIIQLARNLGCNLLAKGVESRAHARELLRLGCRLGQGHGIAAAMAPAELPGWIERFELGDWSAQVAAGPVRSAP